MATKAPTSARGYDYAHRTIRTKWARLLNAAGALPCAEPRRGCPGMVLAGSRWDLAHDHINGGYKGVAHAACNRAEGARRGNRRRGARARLVRAIYGNPSRSW